MTEPMKTMRRKRETLIRSVRDAWGANLTRILLLAASMLAVQTAFATPLFEDDSVLEVELRGPLGTLYENKYDEAREQLPFKIIADGVEHEIKVRVRGKSRLEFCHFPPLRLNFKKGAVAGTVFEGQDKLKLVTHCDLSRYAETDVLEEYAAYRILNELTDVSYRVRLLHIRYVDTEGLTNGVDYPHYGFLIEPKEHLAERNHGIFVEKPGVALKWLQPDYAALVYVHQYLIGNTDWSLAAPSGEEVCCHNVTLIEIDSLLNPVPYDFDMSGLVNARYAAPDEDLTRITRVTQRLYRGYCTDPDVLRETLHLIQENRAEIIEIIDGLPLLTRKKKDQKINYLEKALKAVDKEDKLIRHFEERCLG